jgi:hypothetical protein
MNFIVNIRKCLNKFICTKYNTRDKKKHQLQRQTANFPYFKNSAFYASTKSFNSLPLGLTYLRIEEVQFKVASRTYLNKKSFDSAAC